jgi:hypothetical protein
MGGIILIPEGQYDYEWLLLWQRLAQSYPDTAKNYDLRPITVLPTSDAAVTESFKEIVKFRPDSIPIIDGDKAGNGYITSLCSETPRPVKIIHLGDNAAMECLSAWILEPALAMPGTILNTLLSGFDMTLKNLQNILSSSDKKKDRELHENLVWESLDFSECCERACELFHDFAGIASGSPLKNKGWQMQTDNNGTLIWTATHIHRVIT